MKGQPSTFYIIFLITPHHIRKSVHFFVIRFDSFHSKVDFFVKYMPVCDQFNFDASLEFHFFIRISYVWTCHSTSSLQSKQYSLFPFLTILFFPLFVFFVCGGSFQSSVCSDTELNIGTSNFQFNYQRPRFAALKFLVYFRYQSSLMKISLTIKFIQPKCRKL